MTTLSDANTASCLVIPIEERGEFDTDQAEPLSLDSLNLQSIHLSPSRRAAIISEHFVSEGQDILWQGQSFEVAAIHESGLNLRSDSGEFQLFFDVDPDDQFGLQGDKSNH